VSAIDETTLERRSKPRLFVHATLVPPTEADKDVLDLKPLGLFLRRHKFLLIFSALLTATLFVVLSYQIPRTYRAEILIQPVDPSANGLSGMASGIGGVAGLLGVQLGSANSSTAAALAVLQSRQLVDQFIQERNLLNVLLPRQSGGWSSLGDEPPTLEDAFQKFSKQILTVTQDKRTGLVTVAIEWRDRQVAADWANELVARANQYIAGQAANEADRNVAFLNAEVSKSAEVGLRQAIYSLIESEIKKRMLARTRADYAFRVLDAAAAPKKSVKPHRVFFLLGGAVLGAALGALIGMYAERRTARKLAR